MRITENLLLSLSSIQVLVGQYLTAGASVEKQTPEMGRVSYENVCPIYKNQKFCVINEDTSYTYLEGEILNEKKPKKVVEEVVVQQQVSKPKAITVSRGAYIPKEEVQKAYSSSAVSISEDERYLLERLVEAEASSEPYEGKVAVANVIANRVIDSSFPGTVDGVIKQKSQFTPWIDGSIHRKTPSADTIRAVKEVFDEGKRNLSSDVVYFVSSYTKGSWAENTRKYATTIGGHNFFYKQGK